MISILVPMTHNDLVYFKKIGNYQQIHVITQNKAQIEFVNVEFTNYDYGSRCGPPNAICGPSRKSAHRLLRKELLRNHTFQKRYSRQLGKSFVAVIEGEHISWQKRREIIALHLRRYNPSHYHSSLLSSTLLPCSGRWESWQILGFTGVLWSCESRAGIVAEDWGSNREAAGSSCFYGIKSARAASLARKL